MPLSSLKACFLLLLLRMILSSLVPRTFFWQSSEKSDSRRLMREHRWNHLLVLTRYWIMSSAISMLFWSSEVREVGFVRSFKLLRVSLHGAGIFEPEIRLIGFGSTNHVKSQGSDSGLNSKTTVPATTTARSRYYRMLSTRCFYPQSLSSPTTWITPFVPRYTLDLAMKL